MLHVGLDQPGTPTRPIVEDLCQIPATAEQAIQLRADLVCGWYP